MHASPDISVSVSNLQLFREWRASSECKFCEGQGVTSTGKICGGCDGAGEKTLDWLLARLRREVPQSEAQLAGIALHKALEDCTDENVEVCEMGANGYRFYFRCDGELSLTKVRELSISKQYGNLTVNGRVDGLVGREVHDYKTTGQFDPENYLEGYQWRFYLDMLGCNSFRWKVFVMREFVPKEYEITQMHELAQKSYVNLEQDCRRLAAEYLDFALDLERRGISLARKVAA